jgi:hypothetical protein
MNDPLLAELQKSWDWDGSPLNPAAPQYTRAHSDGYYDLTPEYQAVGSDGFRTHATGTKAQHALWGLFFGRRKGAG